MVRRGVPKMQIKPVLRIDRRLLDHVPIPGDLSENRSRGDGGEPTVTLNRGRDWTRAIGRDLVPVHDAFRGCQSINGPGHSRQRGAQNIEPINLVGEGELNLALGGGKNLVEKIRAANRIQLLAIVEASDRKVQREEHGRGNHRPR